jgi:hypothetical protein
VDKEDEIARQEQQEPRPDNEEEEEEEERRRRVKLGRPRIPETMGLWMIHLPMEDDEELRRRSSPRSYSVINQLFQRLTTLSTWLESIVELSSTLQAQHTTPESTTRSNPWLPNSRISSKLDLNHRP